MADAVRRHERMGLADFEEMAPDRPSDERWELIGGRVVRLMVGAPWEHKRIVQNLTGSLLAHFRRVGSPCRPFDETFYLKDRALDLAVLPDVMVRCGPLEPGATSLSDPVVAIEVVSPGSAARDRVEKWALYQRLPSLRHYVLVSRERVAAEVFSRGEAGWAAYEPLEGLGAVLRLPAVGWEAPLAEVYRDVFAA